MAKSSTLTTTSYALLGLLAVKPWSTYELTKQMDRSLGRIWPRATSKLYEEPKKLVELGLARTTTEQVGKRVRTVYAITPKGRRALTAWLQEPGAGPVLEFEQLLKVFLADHGSTESTLATLAATRNWAAERNEANLAAGRAQLAGTAPFQDRGAQTVLVGRFLTDFYKMVADWADWSSEQVRTWPDDPTQAVADPAAVRETVQRAEWSANA
jgi:PadR family transcriptional regulator AphA